MRVRQPSPFEYNDEVARRNFHQDVAKALNGGMSLGELTSDGLQPVNIDGVFVTVTSGGVADTEFTVVHNLGRVPIGFDIKRRNKAGILYDGPTAWTETKIFLKANVISLTTTLFIH